MDQQIKDSPRIPSLDGLRAISIGLVVFSHLIGTRSFPVPKSIGSFFALGELGVRVFFVISGFLITSILLSELRRTGKIRLSKFYFRRALRIFPPYYCFLLVIGIASWLGYLSVSGRDLLHGFTYTSNYFSQRSWNVGHTWSLSVEEQFYLLWPAALIFFGSRRSLLGAGAVIVVLPVLRVLIWKLFSTQTEIGITFETAADSLATGCVFAGMYGTLKEHRLYKKILRSKFFVLVPVAVFAANALHDRPVLHFLFGFTLMNVGIALCLDWCVTNYRGRVGRLLNSGPFVFVGVISYSIYLWQQIFLNRYSDALFCRFPINLILVAIAAVASYYCVEKPFMNLRQRLESRYNKRREMRFTDAGVEGQTA